MLTFWTAQYRYPGPYRLDITVKGNDPIGRLFAPTWDMVKNYKANTGGEQIYTDKYHTMMLKSYSSNKAAWDSLLTREYAVLTCFCAPKDFCHRHLLTQYLVQLGAKYEGEITDFSKWQEPKAPGPITSFKDEWAGFSNFAPVGFTHNGVFYASVENFYMYYKFSVGDVLKMPDPTAEKGFVLVDAREFVATCRNPKKWGRKARLPWNWEEIKIEAMKIGLDYKFNTPIYRDLLLSSGDRQLVEGNYWHDNFWGDCTCEKCAKIKGKNLLGNMLMLIRERLRSGQL